MQDKKNSLRYRSKWTMCNLYEFIGSFQQLNFICCSVNTFFKHVLITIEKLKCSANILDDSM